MGLFLNLDEYGDPESQTIACLGAKHNMLGEAWAFIQARRPVEDFEAFIRGEKKLRRSMRRERWSCSAY